MKAPKELFNDWIVNNRSRDGDEYFRRMEDKCKERGFIAACELRDEELTTLKAQLAKTEEQLKEANDLIKNAADENLWYSNGEYHEMFTYQRERWYQDELNEYLSKYKEGKV